MGRVTSGNHAFLMGQVWMLLEHYGMQPDQQWTLDYPSYREGPGDTLTITTRSGTKFEVRVTEVPDTNPDHDSTVGKHAGGPFPGSLDVTKEN